MKRIYAVPIAAVLALAGAVFFWKRRAGRS